MKKHIKLYITRHGETEYNLDHRTQGWADSPLTGYGRETVARLGVGLRDVKFDYVYSSSSKRAIDTAQIVLDNMDVDLPIIQDDKLRERGFGKLEGRILNGGAWEQAREAAEEAGYIGKLDLYVLNDRYENIAPFGEPRVEKPYDIECFNEFKVRLKKALDDICDRIEEPEANVFIVSHGLAILVMLYALTGDRYCVGSIANASVTLIENIDGVYRVEGVNDTSYIKQSQKENP